MTQQKSEDRKVAKGRGNTSPTSRVSDKGAKAIPVTKEVRQLTLHLESADKSTKVDTVAEVARSQERATARAVQKSRRKGEQVKPTMTMEEVTTRLNEAFAKVARNQGAAGPDGQSIAELRHEWERVEPLLKQALLEGRYEPGDIRRVWIPKDKGGHRGLGIPNVIDRVVQEAVRLVLEPTYEPTFHESSHGFRPGRSGHTAIEQAKKLMEEGYEWVIDIDLEKFFDRVNHQRLMARLAMRIRDKRLLILFGKMLKAKVVMPDGVISSTEEGVPQGGPLSPLLSNIVLDELDREVARRGHKFVRYADDLNIYVRSERAGQRAMSSIVSFIERRLRLKVNEAKSAVARPHDRHFLGFRLEREPLNDNLEVRLSKRSQERIAKKIRQLTPRNFGGSMEKCIEKINEYVVGWIGYFGICTGRFAKDIQRLDAHIRRRLRAIMLKHWRSKWTIVKKLIALGVSAKTAKANVYGGRRSLWKLSHIWAVDRALRNSYWDARGLISLHKRWEARAQVVIAPIQLQLNWDTEKS